MKKVFSLILMLVMCLALAGCSSGGGSKETVKETETIEKIETETVLETETVAETRDIEAEDAASLITYADMISEIETDIPELKVRGVVLNSDETGMVLKLILELQESKDATYYVLAELTALKETLMNNNGITSINAIVYNQGEIAGIILFENQNGRFEPTVNTL